MNQSIETVRDNSVNPVAKAFAQFLIDNKGSRFNATFVKKDGSLRSMTFCPRNEYNQIMGIPTSAIGRKIVESKAMNDMITVVEFVDYNTVQPRTLNLGKLVMLKVA